MMLLRVFVNEFYFKGGIFMELSKTNHIPLYIQLKEIIENKIETGIWEPGDKIPSESILGDKYEVSRTTVRLAIKELINEEKLKSEQGKGTYVFKPKMDQTLPHLTSFTEDIKQKGLKPGAEVIEFKECYPDKNISEKLEIEKDDKVIILKRLRTANDESVGIHVSYLNSNIIDISKLKEKDLSASLYNILEKDFNLKITEANETIEAISSNRKQSELLNIDEGSPLLYLQRVTKMKEKPIEYVKVFYKADRYKYSINLTRNKN